MILVGPFFMIRPAQAVVFNMPEQSSCDNGSTTLTWDGEGVVRPTVATMTVDGVAIADPAHPEINSLGAVVCPSTTKGNRTSVSIVYHTADGNTGDLSEALTPAGTLVTADTQIAITMGTLGDNAANYTFSLVYGSISSWTTANLKTAAAALSFTISPVRTPQGSGDDFAFCTAVPPNCHATKSDSDVIGASLAMSFEPGVGSNMTGSYFAMTGAMGGFVTSDTAADGSKTLVATLGAPHFLADGTTLNTGNMVAFLPTAVLNSLFGLTSGDVDATVLDVVRTSGTSTSSAIPFTVASVPGGVTLTVPTITFSTPKYTIKMTTKGIAKQKAIAVTPFKAKSTIKVIGTKVKADGTSTYKITILTKNKLGKIIKVQPSLTSKSAVTIGKPVFKGNTWTVKVMAKSKGTKVINVKAKGVLLKTVTLTFVKS